MTWQPLLTENELTALRLLARGLHHTEIAKVLKVRPETAGRLLHGAQNGLRARTLPHTVARGYETGIIQPGPLAYPNGHGTPPTPDDRQADP